MMNNKELLELCEMFSSVLSPLINIKNDAAYTAALDLLEVLIERADYSEGSPLNPVIELLSRAIESYESDDEVMRQFEADSKDEPVDTALLRTLIDQYDMTLDDLPEIGSKSMVSKVLSGERKLTKEHITSLSEKFKIEPGLFFENHYSVD